MGRGTGTAAVQDFRILIRISLTCAPLSCTTRNPNGGNGGVDMESTEKKRLSRVNQVTR